MTAKELWYVWGGKGVSPNSRDVMGSLLRNGLYVPAGNALNWDWLNSDYDVVSYTLGETRERVECEDCNGEGGIDIFDTFNGYIYRDQCYRCECRGYIWKTEVAQ